MIWPVWKFWTFTPWAWIAAVIWNACELTGLRVPFAPFVFGVIMGRRGKRLDKKSRPS